MGKATSRENPKRILYCIAPIPTPIAQSTRWPRVDAIFIFENSQLMRVKWLLLLRYFFRVGHYYNSITIG